MRKSLVGLLLVFSAALCAAAHAIEEGRHYLELPFPQVVETGDNIEVREFFWYGCPHCYQLEPALTRWVASLPANTQFVRTPGVSPNWLIHAQAYYTFESLGVLDKLHEPFFRAMHEEKRRFRDEQSIVEFASAHGVDPKKFRDVFGSFGVRTKIGRAQRVNIDYGINSVPALAVDGRYVTSVTLAGSEDQLFKVLDQLIRKATEARQKAPRR